MVEHRAVDPGVEGSNPFTHPKKSAMEKEQLIEKVKSASKDGRISCATAFALAREAEISTKELGDLFNELKIKIISCQLGCFP